MESYCKEKYNFKGNQKSPRIELIKEHCKEESELNATLFEVTGTFEYLAKSYAYDDLIDWLEENIC